MGVFEVPVVALRLTLLELQEALAAVATIAQIRCLRFIQKHEILNAGGTRVNLLVFAGIAPESAF